MQIHESSMAVLGPGSQPTEVDGAELLCLSFPAEMQTYRQPELPEPDEARAYPDGLAVLGQLLNALRHYQVGGASHPIDLRFLPDTDRLFVTQALGEGEVSILSTTTDSLQIQETRLAGVWRVQVRAGSGDILLDQLEVADIPDQVRQLARRVVDRQVVLEHALPPGVLTAQSVLVELNDRAVSRCSEDQAHIVNLTLLPLSNEDQAYLERRLGAGPVTILSRGYGSCRIAATALRHCWWVQHFNSDGRLIVNTLELTEVPVAALAAREDLEDSADRLIDILDALR